MEKSIQQMFYDDSVDKQLIITYSGSGTTLTNAEFQSETMTVTESICDEQELRFGCCNASSFEIKVLDTAENFKGKKMRVSILLAAGSLVSHRETFPQPIVLIRRTSM